MLWCWDLVAMFNMPLLTVEAVLHLHFSTFFLVYVLFLEYLDVHDPSSHLSTIISLWIRKCHSLPLGFAG